jgi:intracellular sulfur oxidation DsrE/DsrF family protein
LAALDREFNAQGVAIIGVHLEDNVEAVQSFRRQLGISFPLALESDENAKKLFGIIGCPAAVLIDRNGDIVGRIFGERKWASATGRRLLRSLLQGQKPVVAKAARISAIERASPHKLHKAVHLVSAVKPNDPEFTKVLDDAAASLKASDEVVILFDGQSVGALRMNPQKGHKTPLEDTEFTKQERRALAKRLGVRYWAAPQNQFEYVQHLARAGAEVFVNSKSVRLSGLASEEIHPIAKPVPMARMEELVDQSDGCYIYGGGG